MSLAARRHLRRSPVILVLALLTAWLGWRAWQLRFFCDDGAILWRYAKHFAAGLGFRYNPDGPPVQGFSDWPWTLVVAAGYAMGFDPEEIVPPLGVLLAAISLVLVFSLARRSGLSDTASLFCAATLAFNHSFAAWSTSGLGAKLFTILVLLALLSFASERQRDVSPSASPWLFGIVAVARPEGALFGVLAALAHASGSKSPRNGWRALWPVLACAAAMLILQRALFGTFLANTVHAKVTGLWFERGLWWFGLFAQVYAAPLLLACAGCLLLPWRAVPRDSHWIVQRALLFIAIGHSVALASIGGDRFEFRLLDSLLPLYYLTAIAGALRLLELLRARALFLRGLAGAALLAILGTSAGGAWVRTRDGLLVGDVDTIEAMQALYRRQDRLGRLLKSHLEPGHRIAVFAAGAAPLRSELHTLDVLGLNDAVIASRPIAEHGRLAHEKIALPEDFERERIDFSVTEFVEIHPALMLARDIPAVMGSDIPAFLAELHPDRMPSTSLEVVEKRLKAHALCIRVEPQTWLYLQTRTDPEPYRRRFAERGYPVLF